MRDRDIHDAVTSLVALVVDAAAIWAGQLLAVWFRYSSRLFPLNEEISQYLEIDEHRASLYHDYSVAAACATLIYIAVFQVLKLYTRPQDGRFSGKIPRLVRACLFGGGGALICSGLLKNTLPYISNGAVLLSFATVTALVLAERAIAFHVEIAVARLAAPCHKALILGANSDARHFIREMRREPRMRTRIVAVLTVEGEKTDPRIDPALIKGDRSRLEAVIAESQADMLVLASHRLNHDETVSLVVFCEQHLVRFSMIPDLFRMMTNKMEFQMIGRVPLVGIGRWPLDKVWNRFVKRIVDVVGAIVGLLVSVPVVAVAAVVIKLESKGSVFYRQERFGRLGKSFFIYKLRTMREGADKGEQAPGWTVEDDPRRTKSGAFLRKWNIDELPQFWNVLKGDMSLVGPRPERPYFVEQFSSGVEHYMWRHVSKPGLTGWAQVNGLRGDTSISDRVKYDLYYLENWSLAFDFKILAMTLFAYRNAG